MSNLALGFPEFSANQALERSPALDASLARFQQLEQQPDSPIRAVRRQPAREARFHPFPGALDERLRRALEERGIRQLYSHQAQAYEAINQGANTVIVTPTASGKTLCYNLPVLQALCANPEARAMYLFPTKALAEDQLHEFKALTEAMGQPFRAFTFDGDTPQDARRQIRERANVVFTNPDMLHAGILPHHTKWAKAFENLKYFVIDELHYYRGVYGSHLANIVRRLRRIAEFYGANPQFICCSATIANPGPLAESILEAPVTVIDDNGAPAGEKFFIFYNPPVVDRDLGIRRSYLHEARRIALDFIDHGQQTLVFCNSRLATEVLCTYLKEAYERKPAGPGVIRAYRGGYLPKERRAIERDLREGQIRGVVATNALELGIDIGSLDAVVMAGYPGTIASTLQRAGRAGRRQNTSLAVFVASSAPLDQYIVENPDYFFQQAPENAHINADNLEIALGHLKCAAFELPLRDGERFGPHDVSAMCQFLAEQRLLHHNAGSWHWTSDSYPADAVSLRAISSDNFVIIDITGDHQVIGEMPFSTALAELYEKAIYLHESRQYQVERFDYEGRKSYVRRVDSDYFTQAIEYTQVKILDEFESAPQRSGVAAHGEVRLNRQIVGFKKIRFWTLENVGAGNLSIPEQEWHTTAFWLHFPAVLQRELSLPPSQAQAGLAALAVALRTVAAVLLMTDPRDLGVSITENPGLAVFEPNLYLYDNYPGGIGLSAPLFALRGRLLTMTRDLIAACACSEGCPSCVGPLGEIGKGGKSAALLLLNQLLAAGVPASA
jgi:DEAD/DEAH box helicase domain-containing protein